MRAIIAIVLGYILAAPLTSTISLDMRETEWLNVWIYVMWVSSMAIWAVLFLSVGLLLVWWSER